MILVESFKSGLIFSFVAMASCLIFSGVASAQKRAVVFVSPELGIRDKVFSALRIKNEKALLKNLGYSVDEEIGNVKNILSALINRKYQAISYFGHGVEPSMESLNSKSWKSKVFAELNRRYVEKGLSDAFQRADAESKNFGLDLVRNNSCYSLTDTSLANQFVKRGGLYYGVKGMYSPCRTIKALLFDVSWDLDEYRVPPVPAKSQTTSSKTGEGLLVKIVMTCGSWGNNGQYAYPASDVRVKVGGQTLITKGGTARVSGMSFGKINISIPGRKIVSAVVTDNGSGKMSKINSPKSDFSVSLPPTQRGGSASHYSVAIRLANCE